MSNAQWEPRHHAIITVDIEGFNSSTRTDPIRAGLRRDLEKIIESAIEAMPQPDPLAAQGDTGDGKWLLFRSDLQKTALLQSFTPTLEAGIRHHNRTASVAATLRLRVGVHHGEVTVEDSSYSGEQLNHAFRIIENDVVRNVLRNSRNDVVVAVSDDFFLKIIKPGYGSLEPDDYSPVMVEAKETSTVVWIASLQKSEQPSASSDGSRSPSFPAPALSVSSSPEVITLHDLPPTSLYVAITDIHNESLYRRRFPEAPVEQHVETALLLADKVVLHCADAYRSKRVADLLHEYQACISAGDLLFLLGENTHNPRAHFRNYIDYKIQQYGKSDLGQRDAASLVNVDPDAANRTEELLALSPYALIRGFSGADCFIRAVKQDFQPSEPLTIREHFSASIVLNQLNVTIRQLLDLTHQTSHGETTRVVADAVAVGHLQSEVTRLASHNSCSRQILMEAIRQATGIREHDALHEAFEERVSILHLFGTTGGLAHTEVTSRRDRRSPYYYAHLLEHLSVLSETPHPPRFGPKLVMELRSLPSWSHFAAYHIRLVDHLMHRTNKEPGIGDLEPGFTWTRRIPEFEPIRTAVRRHWETRDH
ncbi:hypothetical protein [Streptomyces sp. NPDC046985]|uniref:hypothetical protein n=1 Tax=Streptomyces sp. NPDC046985 TaxID=3155377 RepID=UPI00340433EF